MLWETKVSSNGDGSARIMATKPVLEGNVDEARKILGGFAAVTRQDVYRLVRQKYIVGWKVRPGMERKDGRATNTKLVLDLESVVKHRELMQSNQIAPRSRPILEDGELF